MAFDNADYSQLEIEAAKDLRVTRLRALADYLEEIDEDNFCMSEWGVIESDPPHDGVMTAQDIHSCGTVACIGGYACIMGGARLSRGDEYYKNGVRVSPNFFAKEYLGLTDEEAENIFYKSYIKVRSQRNFRPVILEDAIKMLRHLANTGEIQWGDPDKGEC